MKFGATTALALIVSTASVQAQDPTDLQIRWNADPAPVVFGSTREFELVTTYPEELTLEPLRLAERPDLVGSVLDEQRAAAGKGRTAQVTTIRLRVLSPNTFVLPALQRTAVDATGLSVSAAATPVSLEVRSSLPGTELAESGPGPIETLTPPVSLPTPWSRRVQDLALFLGVSILVTTLGRLLLSHGARLRRGAPLIRVARERLQSLRPDDESRQVFGDGSRILREYFDRRHGTNTLGAPTGHVLESVPEELADTEVARLLDELLQRADAGKFPREPAPTDIEAWLQDADRFLTDDDQLDRGERRAGREELTR